MAPQAKLKFVVWFNYYAPYFSKLASTNCQDEVAAYQNSTGACSEVIDCIVEQTTESIKSNMQAASITLGLMPVVLPFLAPTMTEMAVLAQSWPVFFLVASLGTPAASLTALVKANHVSQLNEDGPQILRWLRDFLAAKVRAWERWLAIFKVSTYVLALAAVANLVEVSYRTDIRTASGFRCGQNMMPLVWAELSVVCYGFAALAIAWREKRSKHVQDTQVAANLLTAQAEILWVLGGIAAELQLVFGIIVFSSLIFISAMDAILVFLRYAASCAVCRVLVVIALALARLEQELAEDARYRMPLTEQDGVRLRNLSTRTRPP